MILPDYREEGLNVDVSVAPGILSVITVRADNLPGGWEAAVRATWDYGAEIKTQYDQEGDPPSRDAIAMITISDPFAEPRIHRAIPGGIEDLEVYRQEVVDGIRDHWIDPKAGKWEYTYHQRFTAYEVPSLPLFVDQIGQIVKALTEAPHTRRAQAITWQPWQDSGISDPPCLQRIWCRIFEDELAMNIHIRSNDAYKAAFMNMYAFTDLQRHIAELVSERSGRPIMVGQYTHIADSFHIYGSYFDEFNDRFLASLSKRSFAQRVFHTQDVQDIIEEARKKITRSLEEEKQTGRKGV